MDTRQHKIVARIGPVLIRSGGFFVDPADIPKITRKDHLTEFLNVDSRNEDEVNAYCRENGYIPRDLTHGWQSAFTKEQEEVRTIADKVANGTNGNSELETVLEKLKDMPIAYRAIPEKKLAELNVNLNCIREDSRLDSDEQPSAAGTRKFPVKVKEYLTLQQQIWDNLLSVIAQKRPLRQCQDYLTCRRFFLPNKRRPDQKYCSPECEDRVRKRKR